MLHQIGVGALGPVFRTYEPTRDRLVAVKVFRLDVIPEQARALADELARAADAGLFHPSIVEPVAAGMEGTVAYRAEEYVAAESLDVAMRHYAPATVDKALPFITQLASALDFARAAGVGHGALHPRDIFVTPDEARATGFGVVDALDRLGLRAPVRRPYSPPERIAGEAWSTPADVFSLGVIAFELLTGRRPSGLGEDMGPLTGATVGEREREVRAVLARAMHANPRERYDTAQAFSAALSQAAGVVEIPVSLAPRPIAAPVSRSTERELRIAPAEPAAIDAELPVAAAVPVGQQAADDVVGDAAATLDDHALDDFAAEPELPSPGDSPREVARKVIAAREVRKRQVKKKASEPAPDLISGLTADVGTDVIPGLDKDGAAPLDAVNVAASIDATSVEAAAAPTVETLADVAEETPRLESVEPVSPMPDLSDRVFVAVDEFRVREAAASKPERAWPRIPERPAFDRPPDRNAPDRPEWAATSKFGAPSILAPTTIPTIIPSVIDEPIPAEIPPPGYEQSAPGHHRIDMLQRALLVGLGLVLGYAAGYFVANREKSPTVSAATTEAPPRSVEGQTPTSGTNPRDTTVLVPPPGKAPDISPRNAKPVATTGSLVVTSSPAKAAVTINGKWSGRTPLTVDDLKFGTYVVRVVQPGYEVARKDVALSTTSPSGAFDTTLRPSKAPARAGAPAPETRAPQAQPPPSLSKPPSKPPSKPLASTTGEIYVDSRPRGARVFIDGKELGVTPLQLASQPLGSRLVRLELADHQSWTMTTQVVAGEVARVTGSLERIR